jgi:hypothetical protein
MTKDHIATVFYAVLVVALYSSAWISARNRRKKRIVLTDYCRGVHFVNGTFEQVLGPGSYRYDARHEQITVMDLRPQPILIERLTFQDTLRQEGIVSVGTELLVREPRVAATALRDQIKDAYVMVRDAIRSTMSTQIGAGTEDASTVAGAITKAVNTELAKVGMGISGIEITELVSQPPQAQTKPGSTTVQ